MRANMELRPLGTDAPPSSLERRAGQFLHEARATAGLDESEIRAIEHRLLGPRRARPRLLLPVLVAVAVLLVTGTVMAVVGGWRPLLRSLRQDEPAPAHTTPTRGKRKAEVVPAPTKSEAPAAPPAAPPPRPQAAPRRTARLESPAAPPPAQPAPAEGALSVEARSLADALARWRRDRDAEAALALLAGHERRFPHGALGIESRVARAEILLGLSRKAEALTVLDSLTLASLPRARELETLRGELRAQAGRCREARADLLRVMARTRSDELGQRAARALGTCP
jgi:hypothetical protein